MVISFVLFLTSCTCFLYQIKLFGSWILFTALAVTAAATQVQRGQKATTIVRKYFHLLALLVYLPGLVLKPCFLYLASGVIFAVLIGLEASIVLGLFTYSYI